MNSNESEVLGLSSFKLGSLLQNIVTTKMSRLHNFIQFDTRAIEEHISKDRSSPFSSYYDRKAKILGNLHGILVENPEGLLINPGPLAGALLRRERTEVEDRIHYEVESTMKKSFQSFNIRRSKAFEELCNEV